MSVVRIVPSVYSGLNTINVNLYGAASHEKLRAMNAYPNPFMAEVADFILSRPNHQHLVVVRGIREAREAYEYLSRLLYDERVNIAANVTPADYRRMGDAALSMKLGIHSFAAGRIKCLIVLKAAINNGIGFTGENQALSMTFPLHDDREMLQLAYRLRDSEAPRLMFKLLPKVAKLTRRKRITNFFRSIFPLKGF